MAAALHPGYETNARKWAEWLCYNGEKYVAVCCIIRCTLTLVRTFCCIYKNCAGVRFEVRSAVAVGMNVFRDVTLCWLVPFFGGSCCLKVNDCFTVHFIMFQNAFWYFAYHSGLRVNLLRVQAHYCKKYTYQAIR
jgi:hypothetical protein